MTSHLWSLGVSEWEAWIGTFWSYIAEWCLRSKNIRFIIWVRHRPESKYTTFHPKLNTQRLFLFFSENLAVDNCHFLAVPFVFFIFVCVFLFLTYKHTVWSCASLCSLSLFPFHFPCVSLLYLSCLEQVEHAAGSSLCVGPFRNLMVSAHVYLPGSQWALPHQLSQ